MKGATSIQERLWELRKDKGLNLEELSKLTGISKSALGSYEKEDFKEINHGNLITLADFYGVSVDYLLCRTENREQINTPLTELHLNDEMVALLKSTDPFPLYSCKTNTFFISLMLLLILFLRYPLPGNRCIFE